MHALNSVYCSSVSNVDSQYVLILKTWGLILWKFRVSKYLENLDTSFEFQA